MVFVFVLCALMLNDMLMNSCFLLYNLFICYVYDFMLDFEVWKEVGMSFNCFSI
jgi:hypothetical protein